MVDITRFIEDGVGLLGRKHVYEKQTQRPSNGAATITFTFPKDILYIISMTENSDGVAGHSVVKDADSNQLFIMRGAQSDADKVRVTGKRTVVIEGVGWAYGYGHIAAIMEE